MFYIELQIHIIILMLFVEVIMNVPFREVIQDGT